KNGHLSMTGFVASVDGKAMVKEQVSGDPKQAEQLGQLLAKKLVDLGANQILSALEQH
ncbi:MAG: hydroxymethylbilane synthase, partial [Methylophilaceae bacterium]|nr:hydroxymethylbilane synthase [Methylophilaceae bacterium]